MIWLLAIVALALAATGGLPGIFACIGIALVVLVIVSMANGAFD